MQRLRALPEAAFIDPENLALLILHLGAAAFELKLVLEDAPLFGGEQLFAAAIQGAVNAGAISFEPGIRAYGCLLNSPATGIGIRGGTSRETYQLHDVARMERGEAVASSLVEVVEASHAFFKIHEGAIFHHRASVYEVVSVDLNSRVARARLIHDSPLNTAARDRSAVQEVTVFRSRAAGATQVWVGRLHVTTHVVGFVKINMVKGENIYEKTFPPPGLKALDFQTDGVWFELPKELVNRLMPSGALREACAGMRNLALALLPSIVACEPGDVGCHVVLPSDSGEGGDASLRMYIYDTFGGVGLCQQVYDKLEQMWRTCLAVLESCACATGCASCTQAGRHGRDGGMAKNETCVVLQGLLGAWMGGGRASIHVHGRRTYRPPVKDRSILAATLRSFSIRIHSDEYEYGSVVCYAGASKRRRRGPEGLHCRCRWADRGGGSGPGGGGAPTSPREAGSPCC